MRKHDFRGSIRAIRGDLSGIQHNIGVYERMSEESITPESREVTLRDLREAESDMLAAIALLEKNQKP